MKPILSILIPTVPSRLKQYGRLVDTFRSQIGENNLFDRVEIISDNTGKEMTIGEKREILYSKANGVYSLQYDDDDEIHPNGLSLILNAIDSNNGVDCVTYFEYCMINGREYTSNHSLKYDDWQDNFDGFDFVRTPFYKDVIKTEIAKSVPFEKIRYGEDHAWSRTLKRRLSTEFHIDQQIYRYIHESTDHKERYGL